MNSENKVSVSIVGMMLLVVILGAIINMVISNPKSPQELIIESNVLITNGMGHGSGVYLGNGVILTAWHCLDMDGAWIEDGDGNIYQILEEIYCGDSTEDIGFIKINPKADIKPMTKFAKKTPQVGSTIFICGTPLDTFMFANFTKGIITKVGVDFPGWWDDATISDARACPGNSGGGVYNENFELIGIMVGAYIGYDNISIIEPIEDCWKQILLETDLYD